MAQTVTDWLLLYPLPNPRVTQEFGRPSSMYRIGKHMGWDFGTPTGTPIWATCAGEVVEAVAGTRGYGHYVMIWHKEHRFYSLYGHLSKIEVKKGDQVAMKQVVGLSGNTGASTGPHLHYEIRLCDENGKLVPVRGWANSEIDPVAFFANAIRNPHQPPPPPNPPGWVEVKTNGNRVRKGPSTKTEILGVVNAGAEGQATHRTADGEWVKLTINGLDGWMAEWLVTVQGGVDALPVFGASPEPPEPEPNPGFDGVPATVNASRVNVRSGPGTDHTRIGTVVRGTVGKAIGRNEDADWIKVEIAGLDGWIAEFLLDVEGDHGTLPVIPTETGDEDNFLRAMLFTAPIEGGFSNHPDDPGGPTNMGITWGTLRRWRLSHGRPAPTIEDLKALTVDERNAIYKAWYWDASGADDMPWPLSVVHFDLAVNGGVGRAKQALHEVGTDPNAYITWRENWHRRSKNFPVFGAGWLRRCRLLREFIVKYPK